CNVASLYATPCEAKMPIDTQIERLIPLAPAARNYVGKVNPSTLWRWHKRGVRGVKLDVVRVGGRNFTTAEALARFTSALSAPLAVTPTGGRDEQLAAADHILDRAGI